MLTQPSGRAEQKLFLGVVVFSVNEACNGHSKHARRDGIASLVRAMQCAGGIPCHSGESGIWNDPRNLQGSLGEILLMHPVRPRRRSRRDQPNDRTSHGVQSSRSPRCERYLLCYLLSSRPSAVRNVCRCRTACMPLPPSPRGKRGIGGCRCFVTLRLHPNAVAEIVSSQARPPTRHGRRFIHNTRQRPSMTPSNPHMISMIRNESDCIS